MKKRTFPLLPALGICLVLISLSLMIAFQLRMHTGAQRSKQIASAMAQMLPDRTPGVPGTTPNAGMPILEIDGVDYAAMLEIPAFGVTLPVADNWDGSKLFDAPARFYGSTYDSTLIIGGRDDPQQFGFCDKIEHGALVTVTDMTGAQFVYTVSGIDRAKHAEAQWLTGAGWDLTLFCHDLYSMEYIAVRCVFAHDRLPGADAENRDFDRL